MLGSEANLEQQLLKYLRPLQYDGSVLSYRQIQGLFFALCCSPQPVDAADWFDLIWLVDEPRFDNERDAEVFSQLIAELGHQVRAQASRGQFLPFAADFSPRWQKELAEWCDGFLLAHQYLDDVWNLALDDLDDEALDEQINTALDLAETLAEWEGACFWSIAEGEELSEDDLPAIYTRFRQLLSSYYLVHMMWYHGIMSWDAERLFAELQPVPRDELCPCGSGRTFAKCCLH